MQPVGQLNDDDANVVHHRQQHFAIILRLTVFGGEEIDLAQLRDAVDAPRDFLAEVFLDIRYGDACILNDVVQQTGLDADDIEAHPGKNARHGQRMAHVGFARNPQLAFVILRSELPGFLNGSDVVFGARFAEGRDQLFKLTIGCGIGRRGFCARGGRRFFARFDPRQRGH